jgi:hypothetical protein
MNRLTGWSWMARVAGGTAAVEAGSLTQLQADLLRQALKTSRGSIQTQTITSGGVATTVTSET